MTDLPAASGAYPAWRCAQELCENWSGDGRVCPCALLGVEGDERPIVIEEADR